MAPGWSGLSGILGRRFLLGELAALNGFVSPSALGQCLEEQRLSSVRQPLGALLRAGGHLTEDQLSSLLDQQKRIQDLEARGSLPACLERVAGVLGRYVLAEPIGSGGAGVVWKAWDAPLRRWVALKEPRLQTGTSRDRFFREAQAMARLSHPHVVSVHDFGEESGRFYLVMELVEGDPLSRLLERDSIDLRRKVELLNKVARAIHHAHEQGIIHRDLKPQNILVSASGEPKVTDFGLAQLVDSDVALTRTAAPLGTPMYMAPEQVDRTRGAIAPTTDVYALGAILYEMLTRRAPHAHETVAEVYAKILTSEPALPSKIVRSIPADLQTIALKALEKDPRRRYSTAEAFAEDLRRHLAGEPIQARPLHPAYRLGRRIRRSPLGFGMGAVAAVALLAAAAVWAGGAAERAAARQALQEIGRESVTTALTFRRVGAADRMRDYLPKLESAYRKVLERSPDLAEPEYLMGRMYRALMENEKALQHQERALAKDPAYAPALYERAVLNSIKYGRERQQALESPQAPGPGPAPPELARRADPVEHARPDLARLRETIVRDCVDLERVTRGTPGDDPRAWVTAANVLAARGILAYHRGEFPEAIRTLQEAVKQDPLIEEAWETLGETIGKRPILGTEEKLGRSLEVEQLYTRALSIDRGYLPHLRGRARARFFVACYRSDSGKDPIADFAAGEGDLAQALAGSPGDFELWLQRGNLRRTRAWHRVSHGEDPTADLAGAEEDLAVAVRVGKDQPRVWVARAGLRSLMGYCRKVSGADPLADYAAAEEDFTQALRLDPQRANTWRLRGNLRVIRGAYRMNVGRDPLPDFASAAEDLETALRLRKDVAGAWCDRGELETWRGVYRMSRGEDPLPDFAAAEKDFEEALRLHPDEGWALDQRSTMSLHRGLWRLKQGHDPLPDFAAAEKYASGMLALWKGFPVSWERNARLRLERGVYRMSRGEDPLPDFASAQKDLDEALRLNGLSADAWRWRGELRLKRGSFHEGRHDLARAQEDYREAVRSYEQALRLNPTSARQIEAGLKEARSKQRVSAGK